MRIEIENTSSPGASFTDNTNNVLLKTNDWINEHSQEVLSFRDFRKILEKEKNVNDNNSRNIFPLLRNCGMIHYENRGNLAVNTFFTNNGKAYIKALETKLLVNADENFTDIQKRNATQKIDIIISELIRGALSELLKNKELNYAQPLKDFIRFLLEYKKINKAEFAYLLFARKTLPIEKALMESKQNINDYRDGRLQFEIFVSVHNDIELREKTNTDMRKEGLSYLTSFGYFSSLLLQAGFVFKKDGYFVLKDEMINNLEKLLED